MADDSTVPGSGKGPEGMAPTLATRRTVWPKRTGSVLAGVILGGGVLLLFAAYPIRWPQVLGVVALVTGTGLLTYAFAQRKPAVDPSKQGWRQRHRVPLNIVWVACVIGGPLLMLPLNLVFFWQQLIGPILLVSGILGLIYANSEHPFPHVLKYHRKEIGLTVILGSMLFSTLMLWIYANLYAIATVGMLVLAGVLVGAKLLSGESALGRDEVALAIALATYSMFIGIVGFGDNIEADPKSITGTALSEFWKILIAVTGFFFTKAGLDAIASAIGRRGS